MASIQSFKQAHQALRKFYGASSTLTYTLDRVRALLEFLGNPQDDLRIVHVAGTSGKTSTAYYTAALIKQAGFKVGLTVSPHVDEVNERLQINLIPLPEKEFCRELTDFLQLVERSGVQPSYFELMIALAFYQFKARRVDYAVVEVGLGGLLDATNTIIREDKVCVITDIGLDHMEILGDTLAAIAAQKAGIIQRHNNVFMYDQSSEVMQAVTQTVSQKDAVLHLVEPIDAPEAEGLPLFQRRNFGLALGATSFVLKRDGHAELDSAAKRTAAGTVVPARMEVVKLKGKTLILDGAHNAQKMEQLLKSVRAKFGRPKMTALVAFVTGGGHNWQHTLDALLPEVSELIITSFRAEQDVPKSAVEPDLLAAYCAQRKFMNFTVEADPAKAYKLLEDNPAGLKLVVGSFYLLNHIRPLMRSVINITKN